jgi:uncharacterized protein
VTMQLDLTQLGRRGRADEHVDRIFDAAEFSQGDERDEDYRIAGPVHLVLDVHKERDAFRVTGRVDAQLELECSRCLEPFEVSIGTPFELRYVSHEQNSGEGEREIEDEDLTTAYYRENVIDLGELMNEQFQLALPMKPLCTEACQGLCPVCGANRNRLACECAPKWEDARLAALKGLLDR